MILNRNRSNRGGLGAITAMTNTTSQIQRVTLPSRCPGAAPDRLFWPISLAKSVTNFVVFGMLGVLVALFVSAALGG